MFVPDTTFGIHWKDMRALNKAAMETIVDHPSVLQAAEPEARLTIDSCVRLFSTPEVINRV